MDPLAKANRKRRKELLRRTNWQNQESEVAAKLLACTLLADPHHPVVTYKVRLYESWLANAIAEAGEGLDIA